MTDSDRAVCNGLKRESQVGGSLAFQERNMRCGVYERLKDIAALWRKKFGKSCILGLEEQYSQLLVFSF
jgi:hypothetical protein